MAAESATVADVTPGRRARGVAGPAGDEVAQQRPGPLAGRPPVVAHRERRRPHVGGARGHQPLDRPGDLGLGADDGGLGRRRHPACGQNPLVVGQHPVEGEQAGGRLAPGVGVVGDRHRKPDDDPGRRPAGGCRRLGDGGGDQALDRGRVGHPGDGAVGQLAGRAQRLRGEGGDDDRQGLLGPGAELGLGPVLLAPERGAAVAQQVADDGEVLPQVPGVGVVAEAVDALDHRPVGDADAEGEAPVADGPGDAGGLVGHEHGVAGVGLDDRGAELDVVGGPADEREHGERVDARRAGVPQAGEAVGLGLPGLVDDPVDGLPPAADADAQRHGGEPSGGLPCRPYPRR
jgi:hypothetical protein